MGGIPYTSGGCGTCRRRKVKCDETKPECLRCTKYGHECAGYNKKRVFLHGRTATTGKPGKLAPDLNLALVKNRKVDLPRPNVNPELRVQLLTAFIEGYLPQQPHLRDRTGRTFLEALPDLTGGSAILEKAGISLAAVYLAKQNQDDRLLQYSSKLYGNTLKTLQGRIKSGAKLGQDVLYTTVILQLYELIDCSPPGFMAWIAHVQGSIAISTQTSAQGERTVAEKLFHRQLKYVTVSLPPAIVTEARSFFMIQLCDSIGKRKAPYLYNTQLWRNSNSNEDDNLDPIDEFINLLAKCSAIMEQVDCYIFNLPENFEKASRTGNQLLHTCLKFEEDLHQVFLSMQRKLGQPRVSPVPLGGFRDSLETDLFPEPLNFPSLTCAESHLVYWATLILLYPLIGELYSVLGKPSSDFPVPLYYDSNGGTADRATEISSADTTAAYTALAEHYAGEICRSVFYFIQPDMKTLGAQLLLAPLSQCVQFFHVEGLTAKLKWCQGVLTMLANLSLGIAPLLKNMVWPQYRDAQGRRLSASKALNG
ncbi:Zn(II)2Cys6 transcription factor domain-containing protein [Aspergillus mulundensis]|uniref:Zn(2)-C6 fungal-type domain-containing protein n=1 Tax=Aspergillus mulundensis TaxID=1810919 RepID=A0A3D8R982_9EURO|nr:Uncharacterized protein DSM5745_08120 [Aspergillus mulundensis]RDW70609.1 Uncharacterized protein DSM5745_08120 [Aspergillus mulundensis]